MTFVPVVVPEQRAVLDEERPVQMDGGVSRRRSECEERRGKSRGDGGARDQLPVEAKTGSADRCDLKGIVATW